MTFLLAALCFLINLLITNITKLVLKSEFLNHILKVELLSVMGNIVKEVTTISKINISNLPYGIYFARITYKDSSISTQRIIISS